METFLPYDRSPETELGKTLEIYRRRIAPGQGGMHTPDTTSEADGVIGGWPPTLYLCGNYTRKQRW